MLAAKLRKNEKLIGSIRQDSFVIICSGCSEVYLPEDEIRAFLAENGIEKTVRADYLCREEFCKIYAQKHSEALSSSGNVIVFSCGVGVQAMAKTIEGKEVLPGCDTFYLKGFQGFKSQQRDCEQCAECRLNETGAICPLTSCSKSLINGPCGGAKDGKCEVNREMDCGWELIYKRLEKQAREHLLSGESKTRDYQKLITGGK